MKGGRGRGTTEEERKETLPMPPGARKREPSKGK